MAESQIIFSFNRAPEGGYEAYAVGYSIFTQADSMTELESNVKEAIACHFGDEQSLPSYTLVEALPALARLGSAKGEFRVPENFNDPDPEIEDLFYNAPLLPE